MKVSYVPLSGVCVDMCVTMHLGRLRYIDPARGAPTPVPGCPMLLGGACCPPHSGLSTFAPIPSDWKEYLWENGSKNINREQLSNCQPLFLSMCLAYQYHQFAQLAGRIECCIKITFLIGSRLEEYKGSRLW